MRTASRCQQVMDATSDALEAGLMTHSEGAMIGTGGFIDTPEPAFRRPARAADRRSRGSR